MLSRVDSSALAQMKDALRSAGLPADDLSDDLLAFRLDDFSGTAGWAALERFGDQALLRSLVVLPEHRGTGRGADLVRQVIAIAVASDIRRLWILTETAAPFFEKLGFEAVERAAAPDTIQATSEFRKCCPASATCMTLSL